MRILRWSRENREGWKTRPTFPPHLLTHSINSQVIIITCLDSQKRQLSHDALPLPVLFRGLNRRKAKFSSDRRLSPLNHSLMHSRMDMKKMFSRGGCFSAERVHFLEAKPKSLHLESTLPKTMPFLSSLSSYINNVLGWAQWKSIKHKSF